MTLLAVGMESLLPPRGVGELFMSVPAGGTRCHHRKSAGTGASARRQHLGEPLDVLGVPSHS
jgi:hypothetical protein